MRDGRKWSHTPLIVLSDRRRRHEAYEGLDVDFVFNVTHLRFTANTERPALTAFRVSGECR